MQLTRMQFLAHFLSLVTFCSPFALKKVTNLKKGLCGAPHR